MRHLQYCHFIKITLLILAGFCMKSNAAEILIRAQNHWMETADTTGWSQEQLDMKGRALAKGCPVVIMPDGWVWGSKEGLPDFIIVKLVRADTSNHVTVEQIKQYTEGLSDQNQKKLKRRRYKLPEVLVDSVANYYGGIVTLTPQKLLQVIKEYRQDGSGWD